MKLADHHLSIAMAVLAIADIKLRRILLPVSVLDVPGSSANAAEWQTNVSRFLRFESPKWISILCILHSAVLVLQLPTMIVSR
jgi:hypothetical protein